MKTLKLTGCFLALFVTSLSPALAEFTNEDSGIAERTIQIGADMMIPYRISSPEGRTAILFGGHASVFPINSLSIDLEGAFGVEDEGFVEEPLYVAPGLTYYAMPGRVFEPFVKGAVPILLSAGDDIGMQGGLGIMWNLMAFGLSAKYSFDVAYFFDSADVSLNLAHLSLAFNW